MFRRSKKTTDTPADGTSSFALPPSSAQQPPPSSASPSNAPQLPPIENTSGALAGGAPGISATEPTKPLPPTHPLSTGQQSQPQEAVPQDHDAQPGPPAPVDGASEPAQPSAVNTALDNVEPAKQEQLEPGRVSPLNGGSTMEETRSGAVSAVDENSQTEEPVKTDSGIEEPTIDAVEERRGMGAMLYNEKRVILIRRTVMDPAPAPPANENIPPIETTTDQITANGTTATTEPTEQKSPIPDSAAEEKVAVDQEEPPPIRTGPTAPGMSATSGPLEEFPEGGFSAKDDSHH
jgi:hypothetical protein